MSSRQPESSEPSTAREYLGIRLDRSAGTASIAGRSLTLTPAEFRLLDCLLQKPGRTCQRQELLDAVTLGEAVVEGRTLNVHICALRRKLGDPHLIETVRREGYRCPLPKEERK
jgi:two-component system, OmpR family, response regulator RegX3